MRILACLQRSFVLLYLRSQFRQCSANAIDQLWAAHHGTNPSVAFEQGIDCFERLGGTFCTREVG